MTPRSSRRAFFTATLLLVPGIVAAKGTSCGNDDIPIGSGGGGGSAECQPADCGPALGMPNYQCNDGTMAGPTGECIATPNGCGWEVIECPPGDECEVSECGPQPLMPNELCGDGSVGGPTGRCLRVDGICGWEIRECPSSNLQWFTSCGDPVCQSPDPDDPNIPNCTTEVAGDPCSMPNVFCEVPGDSCGSNLICTDVDPAVNCPISRARYKTGIAYLNDADLQRLHDDLLTMRMARWHYRTEPTTAREHLGFIIDDQPQSPAVAASGERVDLYGYTSMAAAAIQVQARQIEALERELQSLREAVASCKR
ncbi:MAG: tail fiber domain-containing protein [Myxococcales bacterium]|nr:tail fiber domain-containing protein [Myxococcales bacterium]